MSRENVTGIWETGDQTTLAQIIRAEVRRALLDTRTQTVGTVVTYDPATNTATIQVDILQVFRDFNVPDLPDAEIPQPPRILQLVPVCIAAGGTGYMSLPLLPGDTGILHCMDRSIAAWRVQGLPNDPVSAMLHALSHSVFDPKLQPIPTQPVPVDLTGLVLEHSALVKGGANAVDFLAKAQQLITALDSAIAAANLAVAPNDGGAAAFTAFQQAWDLLKVQIPTIKLQGE